jgi:hypothetical protein
MSYLPKQYVRDVNLYYATPVVPDTFDDEFKSGSSDLATRGWTVTNFSGTTMTRLGPVLPYTAPNGLSSTQYRSSLTLSGMLIQCSALMFCYKAISGSLAFYVDAHLSVPSTTSVFLEGPQLFSVSSPVLNNSLRRAFVNNFNGVRNVSTMDVNQVYTNQVSYTIPTGETMPHGGLIDWDSSGKLLAGSVVNPVTQQQLAGVDGVSLSAFSFVAAGFGVDVNTSSKRAWACIRSVRKLAQGVHPGI